VNDPSPFGSPQDAGRRFGFWGETLDDSVRRQDRLLIVFAYIWWIPTLLTAWTGIGLLVTLFPAGLWIVAHNDRNTTMAFHARQALAIQIVELASVFTVFGILLDASRGGSNSQNDFIAIYAGIAIFSFAGIAGIIAAVSAVLRESLKLRFVHLIGGRLPADQDLPW
jgi:D-alanyl-lipoteichoic acid acyltransferase DltB (MBOAT superfamily)